MPTDLNAFLSELPTSVTHATALGLSLNPETTGTRRTELLSRLTKLTRTASARRHTLIVWLGDLLVTEGKLRRGRLSLIAEASGLDTGTLSKARLVCSRIPPARRHPSLSWAHHCEVAGAYSEAEEIERWLRTAEEEKLSARELRLRIRSNRAAARPARGQADTATFALLRELRATARKCELSRALWRKWSPEARSSSLEEFGSLIEFLDHLRHETRTEKAA